MGEIKIYKVFVEFEMRDRTENFDVLYKDYDAAKKYFESTKTNNKTIWSALYEMTADNGCPKFNNSAYLEYYEA